MDIMSKRIDAAAALALCALLGLAPSAGASVVKGKADFVGTTNEISGPNGYQARFRFHLIESTCDNDQQPKGRWIVVRSGRMDGQYAHNLANMRNAFNVVMTAFLSDLLLEIHGAPNCNASVVQEVDLWGASIGVFK